MDLTTKPLSLASIFDLVLCISEAVDLVSPLVADHHRRTVQVVYNLATHMRMPEPEVRDLVMAAALHDIGGLSRQDRLGALDFEYQDPYGHAVRGYLLLRTFAPFSHVADIVRFHHVPWRNGEGRMLDGVTVSPSSHLLHLADRVAISIDPNTEILEQINSIMDKIEPESGSRFVPQQVKALKELSKVEAFWLDTVYSLSLNSLSRRLAWPQLEIMDDDFMGLSNLFSRIIDFRSPFTATHSAGVAACAVKLGRYAGFDDSDCHYLHLAGLLHDLGKLAVPAEILEKNDKLTPIEYDVVRRHTYHTFRIMETLQILDVVRVWGAYHHERLDGYGYPFHLEGEEIPLGARIISVSDIFTALIENRPYRDGRPAREVMKVLKDASAQHRVDQKIVSLLEEHLDEIYDYVTATQSEASQRYAEFVAMSEKLTPSIPAS
jgi:HD-GYP domain-containing protein (c-di-GMP phosphodiesterase class II)